MQTLKKHLKQNLSFLLLSTILFAFQPVMAQSDQAMFEQYLRNREANSQKEENHADHVDSSKKFHGVFLGFIPCDDCIGTKITLSLNQNNNYLLVMQPARPGSREHYEKGKYLWDDESHRLILTPRKEAEPRHYAIQDSGVLVLLNADGTKMPGDEENRYVLRKSDTVESRQQHLH